MLFLFMLLMDSDPHRSASICGKSIVAKFAPSGSVTSYFMKPPRSLKMVKVMFIIDYTHICMLVFLDHHKSGLIWFHRPVVIAQKGYVACCLRVL
jgi:hypothetical protein